MYRIQFRCLKTRKDGFETEVDLGLRGNKLLPGTVTQSPFPGLLCRLKFESHRAGHEEILSWGEPGVSPGKKS